MQWLKNDVYPKAQNGFWLKGMRAWEKPWKEWNNDTCFSLWGRVFTRNIKPRFPYIGSTPYFYISICISTLLTQKYNVCFNININKHYIYEIFTEFSVSPRFWKPISMVNDFGIMSGFPSTNTPILCIAVDPLVTSKDWVGERCLPVNLAKCRFQ